MPTVPVVGPRLRAWRPGGDKVSHRRTAPEIRRLARKRPRRAGERGHGIGWRQAGRESGARNWIGRPATVAPTCQRPAPLDIRHSPLGPAPAARIQLARWPDRALGANSKAVVGQTQSSLSALARSEPTGAREPDSCPECDPAGRRPGAWWRLAGRARARQVAPSGRRESDMRSRPAQWPPMPDPRPSSRAPADRYGAPASSRRDPARKWPARARSRTYT